MAIYNSIFTGAEIDAILSSSPTLQVITSSGTYTPGATVKAIKVTLVGGGGGAGGVDGQGQGYAALSPGAGSGGTSIIHISSLESSYSVVIGSGGSGGSAGNNNGGNGGTSTFIGDDTATTSVSSSGGVGTAGHTGVIDVSRVSGGVGGAASGGDLNLTGGDGGGAVITGGDVASINYGGSSFIGSSVTGNVNSVDGMDARNYGDGGGGACSIDTISDYAGGDGYQGVCIIEEYY